MGHVKEIQTLPRGKIEASDEWYANMRLAYSVFVCRCWDKNGSKWFCLISRVMEKGGEYMLACMEHIFDKLSWADKGGFALWSDPGSPTSL